MVVGKAMAAKVEPSIWLRNTVESLKFNFILDGTTRRMKRLAFSKLDRLDVPAKASATPSRMLVQWTLRIGSLMAEHLNAGTSTETP